MFSIILKNSCKDYKVFLDDKELSLEHLNNSSKYSTFENYYGRHCLKIKKDYRFIKISELFLFWISVFLTSYGESTTELYRAAKQIDIEFMINVNKDFNFVFDTYTNQVKKCTGEYSVLNESYTEDPAIKSKIYFYIRIPIVILSSITLIPLWILSAFMLMKSFDVIAVILFIFISVLIFLLILTFYRDKKNKW